MSIYNQNREPIDKWWEEGRTKLFIPSDVSELLSCLDQAKEFAKETRSYVYTVFNNAKHGIKIFGYGVPK